MVKTQRLIRLSCGAGNSSGVTVTIDHNPDCGSSRNVLGVISNRGEEPRIIEYLNWLLVTEADEFAGTTSEVKVRR